MNYMQKIFSIEGRSNRKEYWITEAILTVILLILTNIGDNILFDLLEIIVVIATICLSIRRLHDIERPSLHFLLMFIPFYGLYIALLMGFKKGTVGDNKYGIQLDN